MADSDDFLRLQNADGYPHLAYFDKATDTSYVWDGIRPTIQVCPGGYGEPVTREIPSPYANPDRHSWMFRFKDVLAEFAYLCRSDATRTNGGG